MKLFLTSCFIFWTMAAAAQVNAVTDVSQKAYKLMRFMEQQHYKPLQWNDSASAMLYSKWLDKLDDEKLFFTQKDLGILQPFSTKLDDEIVSKKSEFFNLSVAVYKKQVQKTDSILKIIFSKPFDFSTPDNITWPFTNYAANDADLAQRWQQYLKWITLNRIAEQMDSDTGSISTAVPADFLIRENKQRQAIKKSETFYIKNLLSAGRRFAEDLADEYLDCIAWCYDPHSSFMNTGQKKEFETELSGSEYSVGLDVEENEKGDKEVVYLQPGGSAWRSGTIHKGDVLQKIKVNEVEKEIEDMPAAELQEMITGNNEAAVEVTVKTATGEQKKIKLNKEKITNEDGIVKSYVLRGKKNIGYINLPGFYSREKENVNRQEDLTLDGCANDVSKEIVKLKKDSIAGLILDMRFNGGGSMWEAMQLAGIFIDIGPVASVKDKAAKVHFLKDPNRGTIYDGPLLILVNGASASASEFTGAVLQDYNRALIVGGTTYGKGTAQIVLPLDTLPGTADKNNTAFVKVTQQKFYRVTGGTTQWNGVVPDIILPDAYADDSYREKSNSSALKPDDSKTGSYEALKPLPIEGLKQKSFQRTSGDAYFKAIKNFTQWMTDYRKGRKIPLQWGSYAAHYNKTKAMFGTFKMEEEGDETPAVNPAFKAGNNNFDGIRFGNAPVRDVETNSVYLRHVNSDHTIIEAYSIMLDLVSGN